MADSIAEEVEVLLFDVFGTVVDWRASLIADFSAWGRARWGATQGAQVDWTGLVDAWRAAYRPAMDEVRAHPERGFIILDDLHRASLALLAPRFGLSDLDAAAIEHLTRGWYRLHPWSDCVDALQRLKARYVIGPLSNGNVALLVNMAKFANLPWDAIMSAEVFGAYKPDPKTYLGAAAMLGREPHQVMLVAAHNYDLKAARALGLRTAFVPRVMEYGPGQQTDLHAEGPWDIVASDMRDLATRMGA